MIPSWERERESQEKFERDQYSKKYLLIPNSPSYLSLGDMKEVVMVSFQPQGTAGSNRMVCGILVGLAEERRPSRRETRRVTTRRRKKKKRRRRRKRMLMR
jgi:hypothetical protein